MFFEEEASNPTLIGENCHIVAENDGGPRADATLPVSQRNSYGNLILLCRNHHKVIDDPENGAKNFTVKKLQNMKLAHEAWVREQLCFSADKQQDDEAYADVIDEWERRSRIDEWKNWSYWILMPRCPYMDVKFSDDLQELRRWLLCRVWPRRYPELDDAFENFRRVLEAFQGTFLKHADLRGNVLITEKFYATAKWPDPYQALEEQFDDHVRLIADLMLELTRAANLACDLIRRNILYGYRREQGRVLATNGRRDWVCEYSADERKLRFPFCGLDGFLIDRQKRDFCFGASDTPVEANAKESNQFQAG